MEVKIYREPENEVLILDEESRDKYNALAAELGLQTVDQSSQKLTPNVYPLINNAMDIQLKALCPNIISAENYKDSTIPLEVLEVFKYAKDNEMFDGYEVWSARTVPDPLLIGWKWQSEEAKKKGYSWLKNKYLVARWGDCALELDELLKAGFDAIKQEVVDNITPALETLNGYLKNPDMAVRKLLSGQELNIRLRNI